MDGAKKSVKWSEDDERISAAPLLATTDISDVSAVVEGLDYVNSQLIAHGFCKSPGLELNGLPNASSDRIVRILLGMLSQRMDDMSRSEELATKLRTLTYDYQRMSGMHQTAQEVAAKAEREMNLHKSKMQAANRAQQTAENAHKQTSLELQRMKNVLQGLRATHQSELRKREKELERITEKWTKLADNQAKLMAVPSGIRCANVIASTGQEVGQGQGFLDIALEEAEKSRKQLIEENIYLRKLVLTAANELVTASHRVKSLSTSTTAEPQYLTLTSLFPIHPPDFAETKIPALGSEFRTNLFKYLESDGDDSSTLKKTTRQDNQAETSNLQKAIQSLNKELDQLKEVNTSQAAEIRVLRNENADERQKTEESQAQTSALLQAEQIQLDRAKKQLEHQNQELEELRDELERARAEVDSDKLRLEDERKAWQVEQMLAKASPDPTPEKPDLATSSMSPRRVGKGNMKASRKSRSTSSKKPDGQVIPPFETEVVPEPTHKLKRRPSVPLLSSTFTLPPPTPHTSLPSQPAILQPLPQRFETEEENSPEQSTTPPFPSPTPETPEDDPSNPLGPPGTPEPAKKPFPMAKPFAQRMVHAYSPAKPSPLSRILMLGNSANSPEALRAISRELSLGNISEEEAALAIGSLPIQEERAIHTALEEAELGIEEEDPKKIQANLFARAAAEKNTKRTTKPSSTKSKGAVPEKENVVKPRVFTAKPASPARTTASSRARTSSTLRSSRPAVPTFKVGPSTISSPKRGLPQRGARSTVAQK